FTVDIPGTGKASAFLEYQNVSPPKEYRAKVNAYCAYYKTGAYATWSGFNAPFRVLGVAESLSRATHLRDAIHATAGDCADLFWSASLRRVIADPFGPIWLVGTGDDR